MYYDNHGRVVQTKSGNHLTGGTEKEYVAYDFIGQTTQRKHIHSATGKTTQTEVYTYTYDPTGRLLTTTHQLNNAQKTMLVDNVYDELGRLASNKRNGQFSLKTDYTYNVRSWMKSINGPLFAQTLHYTDGIGVPCYGGNISSMNWETATYPDIRGYQFEYDPLSRLTNAVYGEGESLSQNTNRFNEQITGYDKNGNILGLKRYGQTAANGYGLVDNLAITLNGNQLKRVDDSVSGSAFGEHFDFKDGAKQNTEYFYDANGNLSKDLNKKIADIQYNYLNLPDRIEFEDGSSISYLYDAAGTKHRVVHSIAGNTTTTDYCGNVIYENGTPKTLLTDAGFVSLNDNKYHYYLQDHQGNNRVVASQDGVVEEVNHYYPFGGIFASTSSVQPYKYNGKELDRKGGLDWYDYGARMYDAALGRWHVVDPMADKDYSWSVYVYCQNNTIKYIDPDGKQVIPVPMPYAPLPFYSPITYPQSYNLPSDQQIMRHASGKFAEVGQIITDTPRMSYAFGTLLYYQAKNAISPEYEHQRNRERKSKEELDRNQANVAKSIDTNVSGMMPNGDPAPKRNPKDGGKKTMVGMILGAIGTLSKETLDVTNPDPSQDSYEVHTKKVEKKEIYGPTIWEEYFDWKINF